MREPSRVEYRPGWTEDHPGLDIKHWVPSSIILWCLGEWVDLREIHNVPVKQLKNNTYFIVPIIFVSFTIFLVEEPNTNGFRIPSCKWKRKRKNRHKNCMIRLQTSKNQVQCVSWKFCAFSEQNGDKTFSVEMFGVMTSVIKFSKRWHSKFKCWSDDIRNSNAWRNDIRYSNVWKNDIQNSNVWSDDIRYSNVWSDDNR